MKKYANIIICLTLTLFFSPVIMGATLQPLDTIKAPIEKARGIFNDPKYQDKALRLEQRDKVWDNIKGMFDNMEVSRRTVARNWKKFSDAEKKEFSGVFVQFVGKTFIDKIQGMYRNQKFEYINQEILKKKWAIARVKVVNGETEMPVDFRMKLINNEWKVYDIYVEGVSLVRNYRTQFMKILMKETPAQLIDRLKKKAKAQDTKK